MDNSDNLRKKEDEDRTVEYYRRKLDKRDKKRIVFAVLVFAVIGGLFLSAKVFIPGYTGFVISDSDKVDVNEMAYKDSSFIFKAGEKNNISIKSAKISGKIIGNGSVKVFLNKGDKKILVYSNEIKEFNVPSITGYSVFNVNPQKDKLQVVSIKDIKITGENNNILSGISIAANTDEGGLYFEKIRISWEEKEDTKLKRIFFDSGDFWVSKEDKSYYSEIIEGKTQIIPSGKSRVISGIEFDSPIEDKEIMVEFFLRDYIPGLPLGKEKTATAFIDLSGRKDSFVEGFSKERVSYSVEKIAENKDANFSEEDNDKTVDANSDNENTAPGEVSSQTGNTPGSLSDSENNNNNKTDEDDYNITKTADGNILKTRKIGRDKIQFSEESVKEIELRVIENPKYKEIFEEGLSNENKEVTLINNKCDKSCFIEDNGELEYSFSFDIDEGTALNVTSISFS